MGVAALSSPHAVRQPRRIDWRAVFGIFLLLVATGGSVALWSSMSDTRSIVIATKDLPAGTTLGATDLGTARVRVDDSLYGAAIPAGELVSLVGKPLAEPVHADQVLVRAQLSPLPRLAPGQEALTIPISPDTADGGKLRPGDVVQVLVTVNKGKPDAQTSVVLPRVTVYDVGLDPGLSVLNTQTADRPATTGTARWLTLAVSTDDARRLAQAKWSGEIDVALLPPEARP